VGTDYHSGLPAKHTYAAMDASCMEEGCHAANTLPEVHEPYISRYPTYADSCALCHLNSNPDRIPAGATAACVDCHSGAGDHTALHEADPPATTCTDGGCHSNNFVTEHEARTNPATGQPYDCGVCHSTTARQEAKDAIAAYKASGAKATCATCHFEPEQPFHTEKDAKHTSTTPGCTGCHNNNLETVHAALPCSTCHSNPSRVGDITTKTADCGGCHYSPTYPFHGQQQNKHQAQFGSDNCGSCHSDSLETEHFKSSSQTSDGEAIACESCHAGDPSWVTQVKPWNKKCVACHPLAGTGHHELHDYSAMDSGCQASGCHTKWLDDEHANRGLSCDTCHGSGVSQTVKDAIANHNRACSACHPGAGDHYAQHESGLDAQCQVCHKTNLTDVTQHAAIGCDGCHQYTTGSLAAGDVSGAISGGSKNCDACHKAFHEDIKREGNASYHPAFEVGTNPMTGWNSWVSPWTPTSITKCTDCHAASSGYSVAAQDGSTVYLVLPYPTTTKGSGARPSNLLCFKCHSTNVYGSNAGSSSSGFGKYHESEHGEYGCRVCHVVHGGDKRRLMGYVYDRSTGRNWLNSWTQHTGSYSENDCYSSHGSCDDHNSTGTRPATITGTATDGATGEVIGDVKLVADKYQVVAYTGKVGTYRMDNLYPTTYQITASAAGYSSQSKSVTVASGASVTLDFVLGQPGAITGKVTTTAGAGISGATVSTNAGGYSTTTASDGTYQLSNVDPGTFAVTASKTGYDSQSKSATVSSGQTTTVDFSLAVQTAPSNLALNKAAIASSSQYGYPPSYSVDGNTSTRWWKKSTSTQWLRVDLGASESISKVVVAWHGYYAKEYRIQTSSDGSSWTTVWSTTWGASGTRTITFAARNARYVRVYCTKANSSNGYSIYELEVYEQ